MTPEEKAKQLIGKYIELFEVGFGGTIETLAEYVDSQSRKCALIAVEEVISECEYRDRYIVNLKGSITPNLKYWQEVKKHITDL